MGKLSEKKKNLQQIGWIAQNYNYLRWEITSSNRFQKKAAITWQHDLLYTCASAWAIAQGSHGGWHKKLYVHCRCHSLLISLFCNSKNYAHSYLFINILLRTELSFMGKSVLEDTSNSERELTLDRNTWVKWWSHLITSLIPRNKFSTGQWTWRHYGRLVCVVIGC